MYVHIYIYIYICIFVHICICNIYLYIYIYLYRARCIHRPLGQKQEGIRLINEMSKEARDLPQPSIPNHRVMFQWIRMHFCLTQSIDRRVLKVNSPTKLSASCLTICLTIPSWRFRGGVDFLKPLNQKFVRDTVVQCRDRQTSRLFVEKLGSTPYNLHLTPYTLYPIPYTLHPLSCTLHPTPYTLHPTTPRFCGSWVVSGNSDECLHREKLALPDFTWSSQNEENGTWFPCLLERNHHIFYSDGFFLQWRGMYARLQQFDIAHRDMVRNRSFSPREAELERSWDSGKTVVDLAQDDRLGSSGWGWGTKSAWTVISYGN